MIKFISALFVVTLVSNAVPSSFAQIAPKHPRWAVLAEKLRNKQESTFLGDPGLQAIFNEGEAEMILESNKRIKDQTLKEYLGSDAHFEVIKTILTEINLDSDADCDLLWAIHNFNLHIDWAETTADPETFKKHVAELAPLAKLKINGAFKKLGRADLIADLIKEE